MPAMPSDSPPAPTATSPEDLEDFRAALEYYETTSAAAARELKGALKSLAAMQAEVRLRRAWLEDLQKRTDHARAALDWAQLRTGIPWCDEPADPA